jgi:hypothetical protein
LNGETTIIRQYALLMRWIFKLPLGGLKHRTQLLMAETEKISLQSTRDGDLIVRLAGSQKNRLVGSEFSLRDQIRIAKRTDSGYE